LRPIRLQPFSFDLASACRVEASERSLVVHVLRRFGICVHLCLPCVAKAKQGKSVAKEVTGFYPQISGSFLRLLSFFFAANRFFV
jgi:hypothetical protein